MREDIFRDFPIFEGNDVVYFDNAATTQRPRQVMEAMVRFNDTVNANPLRGLYDWSVRATDAYEAARAKTAAFVGAAGPEEIIFTRNATESLNLLAYSYGRMAVQEGDEIVITVMEHHSNILPWQMVAREKKASLVWLECDEEGNIPWSEVETKITARTKIVSLVHVSNVLGVTNPVKKIAEYAHSKGAVVIVDGAQSVPHRAVDVQELGADFLVFSGHKMCGPMGIGAVFGRRDLLEQMPPFLTGGEMIEYVTREGATYAEVPHKFEAGTVNAQGAVGLAAAIDYLTQIGFSEITATEERLVSRLMQAMKELPYVTVYGAKDPAGHAGIVTFNIEGCHPHDVASVLDAEDVYIRAGHHCAQPLMQHLGVNATARASLYFYNTEEQVDRFVEALGKVRATLGLPS